MWSFGVIDGYSDGRTMPFYPYGSASYGTFFLSAIGAFVIAFFATFFACSALPQRFHLGAVIAAWLLGAYVGARGIASRFTADQSMIPQVWDVFTGLHLHPIVSPFFLFLGVAGLASLTRPFRQTADAK